MSVTVAVLLALMVPLLAGYAEQRAVELHERRLAAATRFAALADTLQADSYRSTLALDLSRYDDVTASTQTWVLDADGAVMVPAGTDLPDDVAGLDDAVRRALSGTPSSPIGSLWPWYGTPVVVATPVGRDAQILGAVVMVDDAEEPRAEVRQRVGVMALAGLVFLALLAWLVGVPLVSWVVRPVDKLEERARELARGRTPAAGRIEGPPELRRLTESFNEMAASVELSQRQQRDLVADVSHQLANPLTALRLRLESIVSRDPTVAPVLAETDRMARALEAVIEVSRAGAFDRSTVAVDVVSQVEDRLALWEPVFGSRLRVRLPDSCIVAVLEEDLVATVIDVLLDNAIKYAPDAQVDIELVRGRPASAQVELVVRDHGPGLTDLEVSGLGQRFYRLERHEEVEGTGLGLAIVRLRVQDADGEVRFERADPGVRVRIALPAHVTPPPWT